MEKPILTTHDIAQMLSVDMSTVSDWIDQKRLAAFRTPGGHRRVKREDFLAFIKTYNIPLPEGPARTEVKVLIVEDDADFRRALRAIIGKHPGLTVEEAEDGFTAGAMIQSLKPHVVILDLYLPGTNGFKVCERIRQDPELAGTRVIALSGQNTPDTRRKILEAGADVFLPKPQGLDQLRDIISRLLALPAVAVRK